VPAFEGLTPRKGSAGSSENRSSFAGERPDHGDLYLGFTFGDIGLAIACCGRPPGRLSACQAESSLGWLVSTELLQR